MRFSTLAALVGLMAGAYAGAAHADPVLTVFTFSGNCDDCANAVGPLTTPGTYLNDGFSLAVTGTLTLQDYTAGTALTDSNFVSFYYGGSSILSAFTVSSANGLTGSILTNGALTSDLSFAFSPVSAGRYDVNGFAVAVAGIWSLSAYDNGGNEGGGIVDMGDGGQFSGVPVPGAVFLLGLGLLGVGATRRRLNATAI